MFPFKFRETVQNIFFVQHIQWLLLQVKIYTNPAAYLEPCQTSMMEFFCENN